MNNDNLLKMTRFIAELRKEKGMTQKDLAELLGITDKAVSKWERGLSCPDISLLPKLTSVFGVTANELLSGGRSETTAPELEAVVESTLKYADVATKNKIVAGKRWKAVSITSGIVLALLLLLLKISEIEIYPASPISFIPTTFLVFIAIVGISVSVVFRTYVIASVIVTLGLLIFLITRRKKISSISVSFSSALSCLSVIIASLLTINGIMNYTGFYVPGMGVDPRFTITIFLTIILNFVSLTLLAVQTLKQKLQSAL